MARCNLLSVKTDSKTIGVTSVITDYVISCFYGVLFALDTVISHVHIISFQILHDKHPFLSLWTPCLVIFTSVCFKCGIMNSGKLIGKLCTFYPLH
ncbi:hypothetical protein T06_6433 [Trichinella sp. T6]|nr:hypothetical protein T06_6433 [Trichinella sp. T6]